jgi:hypothetical protein
MYPGTVRRILTTPVRGLENYQQMMDRLVDEKRALKVYVEVSEG